MRRRVSTGRSGHRRARLGPLLACSLVAAACSGGGRLAITDPEYLAGAAGDPLPLAGQVELAGLGQSIAYPEGWHAHSAVPYTNVARDPADVQRWFDGAAVEGPLIFFEVETVGFMRSVGVDAADPGPDDLLAFSTRYFGWEDVRDHLRLELFGGDALQVRARDPRGHLLAIQGVLPGDRVVLITVVAPTAEMLDATLPTWRAMTRTLRARTPTAAPRRSRTPRREAPIGPPGLGYS